MLNDLPDSAAQAQFQAGIMLGQAKAYREAAQHFARARTGYPDPYLAGYNQMLMQVKAAEFRPAILTGKELLASGYERSEIFNLLAEAYLKNGDLKEALRALRAAIERQPTDERNYLDLAAICQAHGNYDLAIEITNIGIRHIPDSFHLYLERGIVRAGKSQYAEAEKDFVTAHTLASGEPLPCVALALTWMIQGHIDKAVRLLRDRTKVTPKDFLTYYVLGEALMRSAPETGSHAELDALAAFKASTRLNASYAPAHARLGALLLKEGHEDDAIDELKKAIAADPANEAATFALARAYHRKGEHARASELMKRFKALHVREREDENAKLLQRIVVWNPRPLSVARP